MVKVESILKWKLEGPVLKKIKLMRSQILSKNEDAVALPDSDLHVTLASGPGWKEIRRQAKSDDFDEPEFKIDIEPTFKVMEQGGKKSWYVRMKDQRNWKEYVMDLLQGTHDARRVYHISIANLTGKVGDSIGMVEERDYKDEYKKFQSSKKMKKYRAELNRYNRKKGTYGNGDGKDASHKNGKIVGHEDESVNRGRAEKSRLVGSKRSVNESIKSSDIVQLKKYVDGKLRSHGIVLNDRQQHIKVDHPEREGTFSHTKLIGTFGRFIKKYGKKLSAITRSSPDNFNVRHYIYDKKFDYTIIFGISASRGNDDPEKIFLVTAYSGKPEIEGKMTKWEV